MAQSHLDEVDGIFLEDELSARATDEADYSRSVVNLTRDADIPLRYFLPKIFSPMEASMTRSCQRVAEKAPKYRLLNNDWGNRLSSLKEGPGVLALVTVESKLVDQHNVGKLEGHIKKLLKGILCQLLRWDPRHVLLYFGNASDYEAFGRLFLEEKLDNCEGFRVKAIEPSILTNPPCCFVEIETTQGNQTREALIPFISCFSGAFKHVNLLEIQKLFPVERAQTTTTSVEGNVPTLAVTLMFSGKAQSRATEAVKALSSDQWQHYRLPGAAADEDTAYFRHVKRSLPLWGIKTGANASGVRITLFVKDALHFQPMDSFYGKITGVAPLQRNGGDNAAATRCSIYPLSSRLEFGLAFYRGLVPRNTSSSSSSNQILYFQTNEQAIGAEKLADDHWQLRDPEDNVVVLFTTMK